MAQMERHYLYGNIIVLTKEEMKILKSSHPYSCPSHPYSCLKCDAIYSHICVDIYNRNFIGLRWLENEGLREHLESILTIQDFEKVC